MAIHLLQAFSDAIFCTDAQLITRFQLTQGVARSFCDSYKLIVCRLVLPSLAAAPNILICRFVRCTDFTLNQYTRDHLGPTICILI